MLVSFELLQLYSEQKDMIVHDDNALYINFFHKFYKKSLNNHADCKKDNHYIY